MKEPFFWNLVSGHPVLGYGCQRQALGFCKTNIAHLIEQGGLNEKETELNPCSIFRFQHLMNLFICLYFSMQFYFVTILKHVELECTVIFIKSIASVVPLVFPPKTLI